MKIENEFERSQDDFFWGVFENFMRFEIKFGVQNRESDTIFLRFGLKIERV